MASYRLSVPAQSDFVDIGRYTQQQWGARQRRKYLGDMISAFERLADQPSLGRARDQIEADLFSFVHWSHVIYFRRSEGGIEIARILHQRQSVEKAFGNRPFER